MSMESWLLFLLLLALIADWVWGEPNIIWSRTPHPAIVFGRAVSWIDQQFNHESDDDKTRYRKGAVGIGLLILLVAAAGWYLSELLAILPVVGFWIEWFLVFALLAQRSLLDHVLSVADGLRGEGLAGGRKAVCLIVGRDPASLDQSGICRAAIESLAENFSDGVVAPAFWYAVFGLPGMLAYKMINTADSMIGYHNERYEFFGKVAAQIDDLANWVPARLSALLIAIAAGFYRGPASAKKALSIALADSGLHRSPNAGWPEGAVAGACNLALGGPRIYATGQINQAYINASGKRDLETTDIVNAVELISRACWVLWGLVFVMLILS